MGQFEKWKEKNDAENIFRSPIFLDNCLKILENSFLKNENHLSCCVVCKGSRETTGTVGDNVSALIKFLPMITWHIHRGPGPNYFLHCSEFFQFYVATASAVNIGSVFSHQKQGSAPRQGFQLSISSSFLSVSRPHICKNSEWATEGCHSGTPWFWL